jgi:hypothetical protein
VSETTTSVTNTGCIYDGKPAVGLDLCHASHPICEDHSLGHQLAPLEAAVVVKPTPVKTRARRATKE